MENQNILLISPLNNRNADTYYFSGIKKWNLSHLRNNVTFFYSEFEHLWFITVNEGKVIVNDRILDIRNKNWIIEDEALITISDVKFMFINLSSGVGSSRNIFFYFIDLNVQSHIRPILLKGLKRIYDDLKNTEIEKIDKESPVNPHEQIKGYDFFKQMLQRNKLFEIMEDSLKLNIPEYFKLTSRDYSPFLESIQYEFENDHTPSNSLCFDDLFESGIFHIIRGQADFIKELKMSNYNLKTSSILTKDVTGEYVDQSSGPIILGSNLEEIFSNDVLSNICNPDKRSSNVNSRMSKYWSYDDLFNIGEQEIIDLDDEFLDQEDSSFDVNLDCQYTQPHSLPNKRKINSFDEYVSAKRLKKTTPPKLFTHEQILPDIFESSSDEISFCSLPETQDDSFYDTYKQDSAISDYEDEKPSNLSNFHIHFHIKGIREYPRSKNPRFINYWDKYC